MRLRSVIPSGSSVGVIQHGQPVKSSDGWGDRLYVVLAEMRVDTPGTQAWAGLRLVQQKGTDRGLFVEHEGNLEFDVSSEITRSLGSISGGRGLEFGEPNRLLVGATGIDRPVCALVNACYRTEG